MTRDVYLALMRDLLSNEPERVREANRRLFAALVASKLISVREADREADLVLAEVPQAVL